MNPKIYTIPILSVIILYMIFFRPEITGFLIGSQNFSNLSEITANVTVVIRDDGFIPENAKVIVYLDENEASMNFKDFVNAAGGGHNIVYAYFPEINYEGNGYAGSYKYSLPISAFGIGMLVPPGEHILKIQVVYEDYVLSQSISKINI